MKRQGRQSTRGQRQGWPRVSQDRDQPGEPTPLAASAHRGTDVVLPVLSAERLCDHCCAAQSPVWRRGMNGELLCNACGLYWKLLGTYRPMGTAQNRKSAQSAEPTEPAPGANNGSDLRRIPERDAKRRHSRTLPPMSTDAGLSKVLFGGFFSAPTANATLATTLPQAKQDV